MKQNQKGFTLIELLAVIVILAIIALIATPIILNTVNNARKKAADDSFYGVLKSVQLAYTEEMVTSSNNLPSSVTFTFASDGTVTDNAGLKDNSNQTRYIKVNISGDKPTGGTVAIANGEATGASIKIGNYTCNGNTSTENPCSDSSS